MKLKPIEETGVWRFFLHAERAILVATSFAAAMIVFVGVIMRYIFHVDFFGQEEVVTVVAMWLYWIGGVYGSYEHSHIGADILSTLLKNEKVKHILDIICIVVSIAVLAVFSVWSIDYAKWSIEQGATSMGLKIPLIFSQITLAIGFILMTLYEIYHLYRRFRPYEGMGKELSRKKVVEGGAEA